MRNDKVFLCAKNVFQSFFVFCFFAFAFAFTCIQSFLFCFFCCCCCFVVVFFSLFVNLKSVILLSNATGRVIGNHNENIIIRKHATSVNCSSTNDTFLLSFKLSAG